MPVMRPPVTMHTNNQVKNWYETHAGYIPSHWKKRIPVFVPWYTVRIKANPKMPFVLIHKQLSLFMDSIHH